ncbi:MAG: hypothetical protein U0802_08370 [Candidatus Binatia bacterium]
MRARARRNTCAVRGITRPSAAKRKRRLPLPHLLRAFNDGSGLLAIPPRYFHDGRYGYETIAHELAHNWWGATVSERWLAPGTGGEWIVEGFAQYSSWRAGRTLRRAGSRARAAAQLLRPRRHRRAGGVVGARQRPRPARPRDHLPEGHVTYLLAQQGARRRRSTRAARAFIEQYRWPVGRRRRPGAVRRHQPADLAGFFATCARRRLDLTPDLQEAAPPRATCARPPAPGRSRCGGGRRAAEAFTTAASARRCPKPRRSACCSTRLAASADMLRATTRCCAPTSSRLASRAQGLQREPPAADGELHAGAGHRARLERRRQDAAHGLVDGGLAAAPT